MRFTSRKISSILRENGYRLTPQRRAVLQVIFASNGHLTPAEIHQRVSAEYPGTGLVTVYRALEILGRLGLICEVHSGGNCRSYLVRKPQEHHHHLICSGCGRVVDFAGCDLGRLESRLSRETGFAVEGHLLEFLGLCPACQK
jgi:Fur family transcriptional regulator, ferric uptake regulator